MHIGIKNINKNNEKRYSSMTNEEKLNLKKRIIQDGLNFSQNFSYSNFVNYQYLSLIYTKNIEELNKIEKIFEEIKFDDNKKKELIELARQKIPLFYVPLNNMYNEEELKYFESIVIPYVNKQNEITEIKKCIFNAYQNYIIYNDIFQMWSDELESLNKLIILETYQNKKKLYEDSEIHEEKKEIIHFNKIEKIKKRIKMHIAKDSKAIKENNEETQEEYKMQEEKIKKLNINIDEWL
ncbi:conserved Plasmodium protein, unknown function [Plasmodium gallinaceum]|uniref:Uncharacterized protein n=1 Tax=Plasmodium gallinaceum TaxID=5849 RepID=A0A1J1GQR4_PLAGA|nr:conserved Plasmodium protein, unknown function [Plasmodium gallinaceum]CRG94604.1 conserved Plasmodium protein, unknown function [Plasmodium gallinaceum]